MIPDQKDELTKQILADSIPDWSNPGFTEGVMQQIAAIEQRKVRRRPLLILAVVIFVGGLTGYAMINLLRTKPMAFSSEAHFLGQIGAWINGKEYILFPLVLLLVAKRLIDTRINQLSNS